MSEGPPDDSRNCTDGTGASAPRVSARRRLALLVTGLIVILVPSGLSPSLLVMALLTDLAGVLMSPALATAYVLADKLAAPGARNRTGNWVNAGFNAGNSAGAALSGQLIGRIPLSACLPVLAVPALLAVVPLLRARSAPAAEQPAPPADPADDSRSCAGGPTPGQAGLAGTAHGPGPQDARP